MKNIQEITMRDREKGMSTEKRVRRIIATWMGKPSPSF